jgi:uncharacterized protein
MNILRSVSRAELGYIISGSLAEGLTMRVLPNVPLATLKTGKFVSVTADFGIFFSLITDLSLGISNPDILLFPPTPQESLLTNILAQKDMYASAVLRPLAMLDHHGMVGPVKTIPSHFTKVFEADEQEVAQIFGDQHHPSKKYFNLGCPLDMQTPVCIDLEKFTERSNGIFGKTGTGKTFLTRLVLAGLIKQRKASVLIFDMHSEYGVQARQEGADSSFVKGLKTLFPDKVAIFSLDPDSTRRRGCSPDVTITIPYSALSIEDIASLQDELNLHPTALEAASLIAARFKNQWLQTLLERGNDAKEFAQTVGAHPESIAALYRKLKRLERFRFLYTDQAAASSKPSLSVIDEMMNYVGRGITIIVEFGNYSSTLCYLLVANIISRRIYQEYTERTEKFLASQAKADEPTKLLICIEEAHKFLNPAAARQTIFGVIAREMRKYYVSLLVIDQRPSSIDQEILSQIGTKIVAQLSDEKDIQAVLVGTNNASYLRSIISSLDSKQQVLVLGHAITMPVVIQTRAYDEQFYQQMKPKIEKADLQATIDSIFT